MFGLDLRFPPGAGSPLSLVLRWDRGKLDPAVLSYLYRWIAAIIPELG